MDEVGYYFWRRLRLPCDDEASLGAARRRFQSNSPEFEAAPAFATPLRVWLDRRLSLYIMMGQLKFAFQDGKLTCNHDKISVVG
jgi:hypothetical protein